MFSLHDIHINRFLYLLTTSKHVLCVTHEDPDGDAVGATLALVHALEQRGVRGTAACVSPLTSTLEFLTGADRFLDLVKALPLLSEVDMVIALDCSDYKRTGLAAHMLSHEVHAQFVNIDHHGDNPHFGTLNIVDRHASSASEIVYLLLEKLGSPIDATIATCLLNGIFFDTGSFQNPNTSHETLRITSRLLAAGADLSLITRHNMHNKSLGALKLWGRVLARVKKNPKLGMISTVVTQQDMKECNAEPADLEGIANFLNSIPDATISLLLTEEASGTLKGSLRTLHDHIDVSLLAHTLGGGGHAKAAGFRIPGTLEETQVGWRIVPTPAN